jgi:hypothetical protein
MQKGKAGLIIGILSGYTVLPVWLKTCRLKIK